MSNETLRECPFCGGNDLRYKAIHGVIHCNSCHAEGGFAQTENKAIIAWNTRSTETDLKKQINELCEALDCTKHVATAARMMVNRYQRHPDGNWRKK